MAVQVSYPGVYIEEFTPGAPIEGVGTSTAAFIGTATSGPINKPALIQSWDAFVNTFGGFIAEQPAGYLAPGVYGFFLNGGTSCYIVRAGTGTMAWVNLDSRQGVASPDPVLAVRALNEGPGGNAISVRVIESSRLSAMLTKASPTRTIINVSNDRKTLTLDSNAGYSVGEAITLEKGNTKRTVIAALTKDSNKLVLPSAIPGTANFDNGTVAPAGKLTIWRSETDISDFIDRKKLTVPDNGGFAPGDRIQLSKSNNKATAVVDSKDGTKTLVLTASVPGNVDFVGGTIRSADVKQGQRTFRVAMPPDLQLNLALPRGAAIKFDSTDEISVVESSGGDTITLKDGLTNDYSLEDAAQLPMLASLEFDLLISDGADSKNDEKFQQLSMNPEHPNYWGAQVVSKLVAVEDPSEAPAPMPADPRPAAKSYTLTRGTADDRAAALASIVGKPNDYLDLLKPYNEVALVCVPGITDKAVQQAVRDHCEQMYDRFAILDSIRGAKPGNGVRDQFGDVRSQLGFAALYYPWILARNPLTGRDELWPPSGHIAGVYARTDTLRGVHKAPANTNVRGALGLEELLTDDQQGPLNLMGINVLRVFPGQSQPVVWGARTTAGDLDRNWQYVNIRRLFLFLEESIEKGIRWAVFEPNNLQLWQKLKRTITEFLTRVWRDGALFGKTAEEAFYVRIDEALNPPSTQALGRLYIEVGVRPTYPAEFIVVRIGIWQGGSDIAEA